MSVAIEFSDVGKRFGTAPWVLRGLSFTVAAGEFLTLIGPSGCGKSTVLRLLADLEEPTEGTISIAGEDWRKRLDEMAFVFQEPTLFPWRTVYRNVATPLEVRRMPKAEIDAKVRETLALVGLEGRADAYPRELSGGMKMRVSLARALCQDPKILLLDEPFAALDEMTRHYLQEELSRLHSQLSFTAVFVTHSIPEAVFLSQRVFVLGTDAAGIVDEQQIAEPMPRIREWRKHPDCHAAVDATAERLWSLEGAEASPS